MTDDYRPRAHEHLIEPLYGAVHEPRPASPAPGAACGAGGSPARRPKRALRGLLLVGLSAGALWFLLELGLLTAG